MAANDVIPPAFTREDFKLRLDLPGVEEPVVPVQARFEPLADTSMPLLTMPLLQPLSWNTGSVAKVGNAPLASVPDRDDPAPADPLPPIIEAEYRSDITPAIGLLARPGIPAAPPNVVPAPQEPAVGVSAGPAAALPPKRPKLADGNQYAAKTPATVRQAERRDEIIQVAAPFRKKRHMGRRFLSLLMVMAMLGGGAYAVKRYVLDIADWDPEVEELAKEVAQIRGLSFRTPVAVTAMPMVQYSEFFTDSVLGLDVVDRGLLAGEWRAVGLLNGQLASVAIGMSAAIDAPAFYDPATATVYVVEGLPSELHRFAVERALTAALLDQRVEWSARLALATPTEALAIRAAVDADAIAVAREALGSPEVADVVARQISSLAGESVTQSSPSVWGSSILGRPGLALQPTFGALSPRQRTAQFDVVVVSDATAFDLGRQTTEVPVATAQTRGMMYWYHALASRIGSTKAWAAATLWNGDTTVVTQTSSAVCVSSTLTAVDTNAVPYLLASFQEWAAGAVPESATEVTADGETGVKITACDPGPTLPTGDMASVLPFGGANVEHTIVALGRAGTTNLPERAQVCLVQLTRSHGGNLQEVADSPTLVEPSTGWRSPYVAAYTPSPADIDTCRA